MGAKNVIASQYLNCGYLPFTRMRSVCLSSASAPANGYWRKSRNGRSRSVGARPLRSALSAATIALAVLLQPDDVVGHRRERRRLDARRGETPDRVHVVVRGQLARAGFLEVGDLVLVGDVLALHVVIDVFALRVLGERRMRRELDARPELDDELRFRDVLARRIARQLLAVLVEVERMRDLLGGAPDELVGTLQVVIAVQRLVHLVRERGLVVGVGARRIEVFRGSRQDRHDRSCSSSPSRADADCSRLRCSPSGRGRPPRPPGQPSAISIRRAPRVRHFQQSSWGSPVGPAASRPTRREVLPAPPDDAQRGKPAVQAEIVSSRRRKPRNPGDSPARGGLDRSRPMLVPGRDLPRRDRRAVATRRSRRRHM